MNKFDLHVSQGETFLCGVTVLDDYGNPYNLSTWNVQAYLNVRYGATGGFVSLNPTIQNAISGQMTFFIDSGVTTGLPCSILAYDMVMQSTTGDICIKPLRGNVYVYPSITSPTFF